MAIKTKYDLGNFRELVTAGKSKTEIMKEMDIKNHPTFNTLRMRLMNEDKKYYQIKESERPKQPEQKRLEKVKIGKNKTISISSRILSDSSFNPGDTFTVRFFKTRIIMTLVDE